MNAWNTGGMLELVQVGIRLAEKSPQYGSLTEPVTTPAHIYQLFASLGRMDREHCWQLCLDIRARPICTEQVSIGTLHSVSTSVRDIAKVAILSNAAIVALVHNHPSGDPTPSIEDKSVTHAILAGLQVLDIILMDHIIIGRGRYFSIREKKEFRA